ncbi:MAG: Helix-hairpin-helix DNA-binding class 1 [Gemmatimonadetes bacterium]|nr:Helix-hairpin-helix DNA-binding class 1 [Gemmatimonadota bacterium]
MPTPSEQKALAFVAIVVLLGGAVRVVRAGSTPQPNHLEQQALARQATAAESAASASKSSKRVKSVRAPRKRDAGVTVVGGVSSVPPSFARPGLPPERGVNGFPPPVPRIDTDARGSSPRTPPAGLGGRPPADGALAGRIDLDRASEAELDRLPRVGPALAHRLVANRDSFGAFGSLEALRRVKGIGPATLERWATLVTFSGRPSSRP